VLKDKSPQLLGRVVLRLLAEDNEQMAQRWAVALEGRRGDAALGVHAVAERGQQFRLDRRWGVGTTPLACSHSAR
jgi:hypothetical protein